MIERLPQTFHLHYRPSSIRLISAHLLLAEAKP
jgi:hypothetical protein